MRVLPFLFFFFLSQSFLFGQLEKTIHQTFPIDNPNQISLELFGDYELITWAGDNILTETNIQLYDASKGILKHFLEEGRYDILQDSASALGVILRSKDVERNSVKTSHGECYEFTMIKVFIPENYAVIDQKTLIKNGVVPAPIPAPTSQEGDGD